MAVGYRRLRSWRNIAIALIDPPACWISVG